MRSEISYDKSGADQPVANMFVAGLGALRAFAGWRFLFVPSYRQAVIAGWKFERWYYIAWDVMLGFAGVLFSIALVLGCGLLIREIVNE